MSDESTAVLQGQLERAVTGDAEARQRLLELTRDRLMGHARRFLHGRYARLEPFAQTDDIVDERQRPRPVPLDFKQMVLRVERRAGFGQHGRDELR